MGEDKDLDVDKSKSDSNDDLSGAEPPIQSVIGFDGLREFIMILLWTINDFNSSIKQTQFNTLREKYQIPSTYQSVYPLNTKSVIIRVLKTLGCMSRCLK